MPATKEKPASTKKRTAAPMKEQSEPEKRKALSGRGTASSRPIWKGAISFGMVTIPVRLHTATSSKDISFNLLHDKCNSRLKQLRWCPVCEREVGWDEIKRGYEYSKGQ